jgi:uncharacterized membrane protein YoaK (UPF0700 family)
LILLAAGAGCVDAVSYLGLHQVLTGAMTGNTVLLGIAIGQARAPAALGSLTALAGFVSGAIVGGAMTEPRRNIDRLASVTYAIATELIVLIGFAISWYFAGPDPGTETIALYGLIAAAGIAMGIQSAAVRRLDVVGVSTSYVTGMLTDFGLRVAARFRTPGFRQKGQIGSRRPARTPKLQALVWLAYGAGAVVGSWTSSTMPQLAGITVHIQWISVALLTPIVLIAVAIAIMMRAAPG